MLSPDEQQAFEESIRRVRRAAQCQLQEGASPVQLALELHRGLDRVGLRAAQRGVQLACRPGCAHCCQVRVEVLPAEAEALARVLRAWPAPQREALQQRLKAQAEARVAEPLGRHACALLAEQRCAVYEHRPAACRKAHSLDAAPCAEGAATLPQDLALILDAEALMQGVGTALQAPPEELAAALLERLG